MQSKILVDLFSVDIEIDFIIKEDFSSRLNLHIYKTIQKSDLEFGRVDLEFGGRINIVICFLSIFF